MIRNSVEIGNNGIPLLPGRARVSVAPGSRKLSKSYETSQTSSIVLGLFVDDELRLIVEAVFEVDVLANLDMEVVLSRAQPLIRLVGAFECR